MGVAELRVHLKGEKVAKKMVFFVTDKAKAAIICQGGCEDLDLIQKISVDTVKANTYKPLTLKHIEQSFSKNDIKLDPSVPPVMQPARKSHKPNMTSLKPCSKNYGRKTSSHQQTSKLIG